MEIAWTGSELLIICCLFLNIGTYMARLDSLYHPGMLLIY